MLPAENLVTAFVFIVSAGYLLADPDPRIIMYDDLMEKASVFTDLGVGYYSQLLFDVPRDQLVVGARDAIYRLKIDNLQKLEKAQWPATSEKIQTCLSKGQSETGCRNYVKVLMINGTTLFTCGTNAYSPNCSWRELENVGHVSKWLSGIGRCPYSPNANITSLMTEEGFNFAGTPLDFAGADSAIIRDSGESILRTKQYDSKWLNDAQFIGSFETESFVYFLFREDAVEYMNCGKKIYARIARVCKNDNGGKPAILQNNWTTFLKARLNCSLPGSYPFYFDEIQGMAYLPDEGLIYATFNTPRNSILGAAICAFNLTAINAAFNGAFKHQATASSMWERTQVPDRRHCAAMDDSQLLDSSKYQLMDVAVRPSISAPLYYTKSESLVHIAVDVVPTKLHRELHIIFVSTEENVIKKISVLPRTMKTCVLEIWHPYSKSPFQIHTIQFLRQTDSLYVGTENEVMRIPAHHCKRHKTKLACINAMDPYCGWNELKEQCSTYPDKDPTATYWHQSVTSCPLFTHPVPGGWSAWSSWTLCDQLDGDESDKCMCSTRQCNNPTPQNGGAECDGTSIQVTNCTLHGGWTNWSAWSACSESCGIAVKTRRRTCSNPAPAFGGRVCVGEDSQEMYCNNNPSCPEIIEPARNGGWSAWSPWSECSARCNGGYRYRSRRCDNPPPQRPGGLDCQGSPLEYEVCNMAPCAESKKLSGWTPWLSSENGTQKRYKFVCKASVANPNGIKITLAKEDERICDPDGICYQPGNTETEDAWGEWSPWSPCTVDCGGGTQYRTRTCETRNSEECAGSPKMTKSCNTHPCKGEWGCWSDWSSCSVSCGRGFKQRTRVCLNASNRHQEVNNCDGTSISQEPCDMPSCKSEGWSDWSSWSDCDETNHQHRHRKCLLPNPTDLMCQGSEQETKLCDDMSNDINLLGVQNKQYAEQSSATAVFLFSLLAFVIGVILSSGFCYYWMKKRRCPLPSSPLYISKQNSYVTVPMKESNTPKRTPSFSKNTTPTSTPSKLFIKPNPGYETATIKRNSHSMLNGQARTPTLEQDKFF